MRTTGTVLKTDNITGVSDALMSYDTATDIANYVSQGYVVKSDNFTDSVEKFDNVPGVDQNYLVELVRDSKGQTETKSITHEVVYSAP